MGSNQVVPLRDCVSLVIDYRGKTPKKLGREWSSSGYRALSARNIKTGQIVQPENIHYADDSLYHAWMKDEVQRGDILITSEAPFGQIYRWNSDEKIILSQRLFAVRPNSEICDSQYLYYWMCNHSFQEELKNRATGTTVIGLRQPELLKCSVALPPMEIQLRIAEVLGTIDAEITNFNQANGHLLEVGQSIFDEKLRLCDLTEGNIGSLGDIAEGNPRRQLSKGEISKYIDMSSLSTTGSYPSGWIEKAYNGGMRFTNGDTLLARITPCLENGKASYVNYLDENEVAFGSTEYIVLTGKDGISNEIFYFLVRNSNFIEYMVGHMNGSSGRQRASVKDALNYPIHIPESKTLKAIGQRLSILLNSVNANSKQIKKLSQLRDALLPKLMSGEIDVSKVDLPTPPEQISATNGRLSD